MEAEASVGGGAGGGGKMPVRRCTCPAGGREVAEGWGAVRGAPRLWGWVGGHVMDRVGEGVGAETLLDLLVEVPAGRPGGGDL